MENYDPNTDDNIFESQTPPDCEVLSSFSHSVNACMRRSGFTRAGLAERMNRALQAHQVEVDEAKINRWFAPSQPTFMPVHFLPSLIWAVKSPEPANILLEPIMYRAVNQRELMLQKTAQLDLEIAQKQREKQHLLEQLTPKY
ncbi:hypothetical protein [Pseudoalteromonas rubra]|uniref:hypothetical protein n=1 Tax=Pseudoalteromonas rubra TaxID=43658 RepID=UPI002DB6EB86|nr:hypothetical protein [Pseudoalteromonas rubra]MEC4091819.1 hypothetical protein [Pseudoalteromonas rubra]